ncbi:hypothetical protein DFH06DRAFT_1471616 [Mycena polygramma]|nr:hypothetical protein DFH06DRAFT_1471616 [Mycena polygramma]
METVPSFADVFGAGIVGSWCGVMLYGVATSQVYFYFTEYPKDGIKLKILVSTVWILNTLQAIFMCFTVYHYTISSAFNVRMLIENVWPLPSSVMMHLTAAVLVMLYFVNVIFNATNGPKLRWSLTITNVLAVFLHAAFGIETVVDLYRTRSLLELNKSTNKAFLPMAGTQVGADVIIAASLCWVLQGNRSEFRRTNSIINTLMIYAINRCLLTAAAALVELLALALQPEKMWYVGSEFTLIGLYTNAFLASLNSRHRFRHGAIGSSDYHLSNLQSGNSALEVAPVHVAGRDLTFTEAPVNYGEMKSTVSTIIPDV